MPSGRRNRRARMPSEQLRHLLQRILEFYERASAAYHRMRAGPVHPESHILERLRFTSWQSPVTGRERRMWDRRSKD